MRVTGGQRAALVGAVFGLVFVLVNAGDLEGPWPVTVRVAGVVAFVVVVGLVLAAPGARDVEHEHPGPVAWRTYWTCVGLEVVALLAGTRVLAAAGREEVSLSWVVLVVGVHFVPFAWAFDAPAFGWLGWALVALGLVSGGLGLAGSPSWVVTLLSGIAAGAALLVFAAWRPVSGLLEQRRRPPTGAPAG